jgi:hypothetical protein
LARIGTGKPYDAAVGELWPGLARTLARLDVLAGDPASLDEDGATEILRRLQYGLHVAFEQLAGLEPPPGAATAHAELSAALAGARDATAEVADAVAAWGEEGVATLLHEWRGALFRVRLARLRLTGPPQRPAKAIVAPPPAGIGPALVALLLALGGALAFVAGATFGLWPIWAGGLLAVCGSVLAYRP